MDDNRESEYGFPSRWKWAWKKRGKWFLYVIIGIGFNFWSRTFDFEISKYRCRSTVLTTTRYIRATIRIFKIVKIIFVCEVIEWSSKIKSWNIFEVINYFDIYSYKLN